MKGLGAVLLGLSLVAGTCGLAWAYAGSGFTYYAIGIPEGRTITVDGVLDDWDWFPEAAEITTDMSYPHVCEGANCEVVPSDFDWTIRVAWAPEPDNRIYWSVERYDDVWLFPEVANEPALHKYDDVELVVDPDASGGTAGMTLDEEGYYGRYGQQWYCSPGLDEAEMLHYCIYIGTADDRKQADWMDKPPYAEFMYTREGNTGYFEGALALFDFMDIAGPETSSRHILREGEPFGFGFLSGDIDVEPGKYDAQWKTHSGTASWKNADEIPDFIPLPPPVVAIEPGSWGAVKSLFR